MPTKRRKQIISLLEETGSVALNDLAELFPDVSLMTLRRDLIKLEEEGIVIRTHGGAVRTNKVKTFPGEESSYDSREREHREAKNLLAKKALEFVEIGRSIFLDSGSTIMALTHMIPDSQFSFITSGINIALTLLSLESPTVVVLGGAANRNTYSTSCPLSRILLNSLNIDIAFLSASGFSQDAGFTVSNAYEAELKSRIMEKAKKIIILMDSSKLNKTLPYTFAHLKDVDVLITDAELDSEVKGRIEEKGVLVK